MKLSKMIVICTLGLALAHPAIADESQPATEGKSVENLIAEHFPENFRTMKAIAKCESGLVHRVDGELLPNADGGTARGTFQVLMRVHEAEMRRRGLDPNNDDDYMEYVRILYEASGYTPWASSKNCWKKKVG